MRRLALGLVVVAALVACTDSTPTATRSPDVDRIRFAVGTDGTLQQNILDLIAQWPKSESKTLLSQWNTVLKLYVAGQSQAAKLDDAKKKLFALISLIQKTTPHMADQQDETKQAAAARLVWYMVLYVYGEGSNENTAAPPYVPGADNAVGLLTPNGSLTLVTPSGHAGVQFGDHTVGENRIIVITQDLGTYVVPCGGPLPTTDCQYPLFYHIESFPAGPLLKPAVADICLDPHPAEHDDLRLAHTDPNDPENIELLPVTPADFIDCGDIGVDVVIDHSLLGRGVHLASALASRVGKLLTPKSAYAIDQGAGGTFTDFSPFNWVLPSTIDFESPDLGTTNRQISNPYVANGVTFTPIGTGAEIGLVKNASTSACVPPPSDNQTLGTGTTAGGDNSIGLGAFDIKATFSTPLVAGQSVTLDVQALSTGTARVRFYNSDDGLVGDETTASIPSQGSCYDIGGDRGKVSLTATAGGTVAYAIIDVLNEGPALVFVIDNFNVGPVPVFED